MVIFSMSGEVLCVLFIFLTFTVTVSIDRSRLQIAKLISLAACFCLSLPSHRLPPQTGTQLLQSSALRLISLQRVS